MDEKSIIEWSPGGYTLGHFVDYCMNIFMKQTLKNNHETSLVVFHSQNYMQLGYAGTTTDLLIVLNTPKNPYLI